MSNQSSTTVKRFILWHECDSTLRKDVDGVYRRKPLIVLRSDNPVLVLELCQKLHGVMSTIYPAHVKEEAPTFSSRDKRFKDIFPQHYYCVVVLKQVMSDEVYLRVARYLSQFNCLPLAETEWVVRGADPAQVDSLLHKFYLPEDVDVEEVQPVPTPEVEAPEPVHPEPEVLEKPTSQWNKAQIIAYLVRNGHKVAKQATKQELLALV